MVSNPVLRKGRAYKKPITIKVMPLDRVNHWKTGAAPAQTVAFRAFYRPGNIDTAKNHDRNGQKHNN